MLNVDVDIPKWCGECDHFDTKNSEDEIHVVAFCDITNEEVVPAKMAYNCPIFGKRIVL